MRFVTPESVRLDLTDGAWIEVKKDLTVGEEKRYRASGLGGMGGGAVGVDWEAMAFSRADAYLVDWSAKDAKGKDIKLTPQAIRDLDVESFNEIDAAIMAHIGRRTEEKKAPTPTPMSLAPSA